MAAFTTFKPESLARYLVMFELGELHSYEPISEGIENSNYYVTLDRDGQLVEFVLTITEALAFDEVPFFNDLMSQLSRHGLPVPDPQRTLDGMPSTIFCGKPSWLFTRLPGAHPNELKSEHCFLIGTKLAELHEAAKRTRYHRPNPYDSSWVDQTLGGLKSRLLTADWVLLNDIAVQYQSFGQNSDLPKGIIHGDLFRDNTLFVGDELTGIIDFYHACDDFLIQDIAITINDWCTTPNGQFDDERRNALLAGYQSQRKLTQTELDLMTLFQQFAALRFLLTRYISGEETPLKDPEEFLRVVRHLSR